MSTSNNVRINFIPGGELTGAQKFRQILETAVLLVVIEFVLLLAGRKWGNAGVLATLLAVFIMVMLVAKTNWAKRAQLISFDLARVGPDIHLTGFIPGRDDLKVRGLRITGFGATGEVLLADRTAVDLHPLSPNTREIFRRIYFDLLDGASKEAISTQQPALKSSLFGGYKFEELPNDQCRLNRMFMLFYATSVLAAVLVA